MLTTRYSGDEWLDLNGPTILEYGDLPALSLTMFRMFGDLPQTADDSSEAKQVDFADVMRLT